MGEITDPFAPSPTRPPSLRDFDEPVEMVAHDAIGHHAQFAEFLIPPQEPDELTEAAASALRVSLRLIYLAPLDSSFSSGPGTNSRFTTRDRQG